MGAGSCGQGDGDGDGLRPSCQAATLARGLVYRIRVTGRARPRALSCAGERRQEPGISLGLGAAREQELLGPAVRRGGREQGPWCYPIMGRDGAWGQGRESLGLVAHGAQRTVPLMLALAMGLATLRTDAPVMTVPGDAVLHPGPSSCTEIFMPTSL